MKPMRKPEWSAVSRIVREEAAAAGVEYDHVIGRGGVGLIRQVRHRAIRRILAETGCSHRGLAEVWGLSMRTVTKAAKLASPPPAHPYDEMTVFRLRWLYGADRTSEIISGADVPTNVDLRAWRGLGEGAAR